jgi:hypothetical protein
MLGYEKVLGVKAHLCSWRGIPRHPKEVTQASHISQPWIKSFDHNIENIVAEDIFINKIMPKSTCPGQQKRGLQHGGSP